MEGNEKGSERHSVTMQRGEVEGAEESGTKIREKRVKRR